MRRILNFGSLNLDKTYTVDHIIHPGETLNALQYDEFIGGKGLNQSIALARAGSAVYHAGLVGEIDGAPLLERLQENGVDTTFVETRPLPSGHTLLQVDAQGANAIIVAGGANRAVDVAFAEEVLSHFTAGDVLLLQNEISALADIVEIAAARGMKIVLNPSPMDAHIETLDLRKVSLFLVNEGEGAAMTGVKAPEAILDVFRDKAPHQSVVLTLGENGAWYQGAPDPLAMDAKTPLVAEEQTRDTEERRDAKEARGEKHTRDDAELLRFFVPAETIQPVDTTGAGDTFTGYFIAALLAGHTPHEAMVRATQASALACLTKGASNAIPRKEEVPWSRP